PRRVRAELERTAAGMLRPGNGRLDLAERAEPEAGELHVLLQRRLARAGRDEGHAEHQVAPAWGPGGPPASGSQPISARPTLQATQTGLSWPSPSIVNLVTTCHQPWPSSSTESTSARARTRLPVGTAAGNRTRAN